VGAILARFKSIFLYVGLFTLFVNVLLLLPSLYMMMVFDRVIPGRSEMTLILLTVGVLGAAIVMMLLEYLRSRLLIAVGAELDHVLGPKLLDTMLRRTSAPNQPPLSASLRDVATLRTFLAGQGIFALFDAPWLPVYMIIIFMFSATLGQFAILGAVVLAAIGFANERLTRSAIDSAQAATSKAARFSETAFRNAEVVHAVGMGAGIKQRWGKMNSEAVAHHVRGSARASLMSALTKFARQAVQTCMMAIGVLLLIDNNTSPGVLLAATFLVSRAMFPVEQLIGNWTILAEAQGAYRRMAELLKQTPAADPRTELPTPTGHINVEQLVFAIAMTGRPIIRGISFEIKPGESLGIIGPSASGKSTLARLLLGVWQPSAGVVRLDGADIHTWSRELLGPHIGYLPQDIELFAGTVAENIARMGEVDSALVVKAAQRAHAHELILRLPKGYDTEIGDSGAVLSGGQRQRIALARALYGNPRFVILDEPNSNLDGEGENALMRALREMKQEGVTVVVIAHRPALFAQFDRLLVLREGMIDAFGPAGEVLLKFAAPRTVSAVPAAGKRA